MSLYFLIAFENCTKTIPFILQKLDAVDYSEKLTEIFRNNDIKSITLTRMTVPCCGGMEYAIKRAIEASGKDIPLEVAVISPDGSIVEIRK